MECEANICFSANGEQSVFYIRQGDGQWHRYENGGLTPWSKLDGLKLQQVIPIVIKSGGEVVVYNRIFNNYGYFFFRPKVPIGFNSTEKKVQKFAESGSNPFDYIEFIHDSIFFGILFFAAILNFFFFLTVREWVFLYYSVYLLLLGIGRMPDECYYLFLRESRVFDRYLMFFVWAYTIPFFTVFVRELLHTKVNQPRWDKFLIALLIWSFVGGIWCVYPNSYTVDAVVIIVGLTPILLLIGNLVSFLFSMTKEKTNRVLIRLIFFGSLVWGICWSIRGLYRAFGFNVIGVNLTALVNTWWTTIETVSLIWMVCCFSWMLLQRFRGLQKQLVEQALEREKEKNQLIAAQKVELETKVTERTSELKNSLSELKSTQNQLIQREKMASLGELTAGIAHEIQNPLNFVNNFSDVSTELVEEMQAELKKGDKDEAIAISEDIKQNLEKIRHHGKRADFIVKGMLEHSRTSTGEKQSTNLNILVDEFLKLAYHGLRAKDKSFNADMVTYFDKDLPRIHVSQQDMGRVMLNLFNNAFYAVQQKAKTAGPDYKPTVEVSTFTPPLGGWGVSVKDNGTGIPENIREKIMQPFFTTKPTGEGTGLGLSLSYDIIVKGHGGSIDFQTKEGEFTEFTVTLPSE
jgi:signal transduction histidine kinase